MCTLRQCIRGYREAAYIPPENDDILMRFWNDDPKQIQIRAEVRDLLQDVTSEPILDALQGLAAATEVCGPLLDAAELAGSEAASLAGELEAIQRLAEGRDLRGIAVICKLDKENWMSLRRARMIGSCYEAEPIT